MKKIIVILTILILLLGIIIIKLSKRNDKEEEHIELSTIIEVEKSQNRRMCKYIEYLKKDNRKILLSCALDEVYYNGGKEGKVTIKEYLSQDDLSLEEKINNLTNNLNLINMLRDGGTKIYRLREADITMVVCNNISGNKDIYIGDSSMSFDNDVMCRKEGE